MGMNKLEINNIYKPNRRIMMTSLVMISIGVLSAIIAFVTDAHAAWTNLLFNNLALFTI